MVMSTPACSEINSSMAKFTPGKSWYELSCLPPLTLGSKLKAYLLGADSDLDSAGLQIWEISLHCMFYWFIAKQEGKGEHYHEKTGLICIVVI